MQSVLAQVLKTLHDKGYSSRYICLCANEIGCPMYRRRWFLLAKHHTAKMDELCKLVPPPPTMDQWRKDVQKPWNPEHKPKMEELMLHSASLENSDRLRMLGNSVVPQ